MFYSHCVSTTASVGGIPRVFDGEALHLQQLPQRIILAVNYVLPLFVIQLLPHDVLAQVVHHLHKETGY